MPGTVPVKLHRYAAVATLLLSAAACDGKSRDQLKTLALTDSLRRDSLSTIKNELLNEVMTSTQFINDINGELAKARNLQSAQLAAKAGSESEMSKLKEERQATLSKIQLLVARLDSVESHLASTRARAQSLAKHDSQLARQVAEYEKTVTGLRKTVEQQRADFQAAVDSQNAQIASLNSKVDTLTQVSTALADTVGQLTTEKNTAYYVVGTRDELVKRGILVEEGPRKFAILGRRPVTPARALDTAAFTRIDRTRETEIKLPAGEYTIVSRHNPSFAQPEMVKGGKIAGGIKIENPERFWASSRYLIVMKS